MNRLGQISLASVIALIMTLTSGAATTVGAVVADAPVDGPVATESPIATNEFIPEERDLTDCIGVLERPGCGSERRGGWRQTAVLGVILLGLVIVFGNVARGVRRNRSN